MKAGPKSKRDATNFKLTAAVTLVSSARCARGRARIELEASAAGRGGGLVNTAAFCLCSSFT
jgi:hypothetical protein